MAAALLIFLLPWVAALTWASFLYYRYGGRLLGGLVLLFAGGVASSLFSLESAAASAAGEPPSALLSAAALASLGVIHYLCELRRKEKFLGKTPSKQRHPRDRPAELQFANQRPGPSSAEDVPAREDRAPGRLEQPLEKHGPAPREGNAALREKILEGQQAKDILAGYNRVLEKLALGADLQEILEGLASIVESRIPGTHCLIFRRDADGRFCLAAAAGIPEDLRADASRFLPAIFARSAAADDTSGGQISIGRHAGGVQKVAAALTPGPAMSPGRASAFATAGMSRFSPETRSPSELWPSCSRLLAIRRKEIRRS